MSNMMMIKKITAIVGVLGLSISAACAQSSPNLTFEEVLTPAQWNQLFINKQDTLGFTPLNIIGGVMSGRLVTAPPSSTTAGFNLTPGSTPASPVNGDLWTTSSGIFAQVNGTTINLTGAASTSFAGTSPITVSFPSGIVTYACATCGVTGSPLSQFAATTSAQLAGVISDETGTAGFSVFSINPTLTGVTINAGSTIFGGSISAPAWTTTGIRIKDTGGTLTDTSSSGTVAAGYSSVMGGSAIAASSATTFTNYFGFYHVAPTAGANVTLTNAWAVGADSAKFGTSNQMTVTAAGLVGINNAAAVASNSATALTVGANGATNPALQVDASTASQVAGLDVVGAVTGGTVAVKVIDSGSNSNLSLNAKGTGSLFLQNIASGSLQIGAPTTMAFALTYGSVTLANSVTGTGSMVLSVAPTITGGSGAFTSGLSNATNQNASTAVGVSNSTAGTGSSANFVATSDTATGFFGATSSLYSAQAVLTNRAYMFSTAASSGIALDASGTSDPIVFATNDIERARVLLGFMVGSGLTDPGAGIANIQTGIRINNAAPSNHILLGNGSNYVDSATFPTTGLNGALQAAQEPAHTGDCTNTAGSLALTCLNTNGVAFTSTATAAAGQLPGEPSTGSAAAGKVGEYISSTVASPGVSLTSGSALNMTSISLTAGDWDVSCNIIFLTTGTTVYNFLIASLNTTSNTAAVAAEQYYAATYATAGISSTTLLNIGTWVGPWRVSLASTTTVYCVADAGFSASTMSAYGKLRARRVR